MKWPISYDNESMTLTIRWGKHSKYLQCPFATWWKARKHFKRPKFNFYFGPTCKFNGHKITEFGEYDDWEQKGFWPAVSTEWLKWYTPKWFPIHIVSQDIGWKDKWRTPRYESRGYFIIYFGRSYHHSWQIGFSVTAPEFFIYDCTMLDTEDLYWESMLWYVYYKNRDLITARNSLQSHWSTTEWTKIKKFTVVSTTTETIKDKNYYVIGLRCRYLLNKLFWNFTPTTDIRLAIKVWKGESFNSKSSSFIYKFDNLVYVYISKTPNTVEFIEIMESNPDNIELETCQNIDLGPTFKDIFLTKRAIKEIREWKEKSNSD